MNFKEAINEIKYDNCNDCESSLRFNENCDGCHYKCAIEALENAHKYRWHDLQKNPDDLPEKGSKVEAVTLFDDKEELSYLYYKPEWIPEGFEWNTSWEVLRWREIEPCMIHPETSREDIRKCERTKEIDEAITIVCDAAKKQIAVAPIVYTDTRQQVDSDVQVDTYECPMCGSYLCDCDNADEYGTLYCPYCGQKIDWSVLDG